ncbi:ATP-binding protein [Parapedobacter sp. ISTM3]|nr:ATP-binding protein [Parapedobacter sp. ISTM3]MBK1438791.1 ATP-binding protein [Parapedobacter sp. ISTM3]
MLFVPEMYEVKAQREMLLFVNRNIIHNAVKHAPEKGQLAITATLRDADHQITVCIADNGGGIPADVLPYLFQKDKPAGQQASESRGSGLALIICHEMVSTMDGDLWAANNDDAGASFYYSLPLALVDGHDADLPASATDGSVTQP